jgi:hypothetical protein
MAKVAVLDKNHKIRIGREPFVLVPLELWHRVEGLLEDQEALASKSFRRKIAKGRKDAAAGKLIYPFR